MNEPFKKWQEFYITGEYKGFRKKQEKTYKLSGKTLVTFSNGKREFFASGVFKEEALAKIFSRIDQHSSNN